MTYSLFCSVLFCSVDMSCSILFHFVPFYYVISNCLFCSVPHRFVLFCSVRFGSALFCSVPFRSVLFWSVPFRSVLL